jgi:5-formyltetrahydrofolate cyclo-ligase
METFYDKKALRREIINKRNNMDINEKKIKDKKIIDKFYNSEEYKKAEKIFIYISYSSEIDTKSIINKALKDNKKIYVPRTEFKIRRMDAIEITSLDNLTESSYGTLEPGVGESYIDPNELDLIIVPGVAFDRNGGRMGYGAGFYDRYFKKINKDNAMKIKKLALAYDFQVIERVPMDKNDMPIDNIITDKEFI